MGEIGFSEFKASLKFELQERTDLSSHTILGDLYGIWINKAYRTLTNENRMWSLKRNFYFPELHTEDTSQSTADGRAYVTKPTAALYVEGVWDRTNDVTLENISWSKYKGYTGRADSTAEGEPKEWTRRANRIYLYRTPDDTYALTIYYRKRIDALDGTNYDTTEIGVEWDEVILKLAVIQSLMRLKRYDDAEKEKAEWLGLVSGLIGIYDKEEKDRKLLIERDLASQNYEYR